jgi:hypothetical protein
MLPEARIAGEDSRHVTERQVQHSRGDVDPGIMGAHTAIEQRDFPKPLGRFDQCHNNSLPDAAMAPNRTAPERTH